MKVKPSAELKGCMVEGSSGLGWIQWSSYYEEGERLPTEWQVSGEGKKRRMGGRGYVPSAIQRCPISATGLFIRIQMRDVSRSASIKEG